MIRFSFILVAFYVFIGQLSAQPPCDPPIIVNMSVSGPVCAGGTVFITFDLEDDDDEDFSVFYNIGGVNYSLENIEDDVTIEYVANFSTSVTLVQVVDNGNACISVINQILPITVISIAVNISAENPDCGVMNGTISAQALSGTAPYTFSLNGGASQNSGFFSSLGSGPYTIEVVDALGCYGTTSTMLNPGEGPLLTISSQTNPGCGESNGSISVVASGGTAPYTYHINGGAPQGSGNFSGLGPGDYTIAVVDVNGCENTVFVMLSSSDAPTLTISSQTNPGCGESNGSISVVASGGTAPYTYHINGGVPQNSGNFSGLGPGDYTIAVEDVNGCENTVFVILSSSDAPTLTISSQTNPGCGESNGSISVVASGGTAPYTYHINGGVPQGSGNFSGLGPGVYDIAVTDIAGCIFTLTETLSAENAPEIVVLDQQSPGCGQNDGTIVVSASGGNPPYLFSFDGGLFGTSSAFSNLLPGDFDIVVKDNSGCLSVIQVTLSDIAQGLPVANIVSGSLLGCSSSIFSLEGNLPGGTTGAWVAPTVPQAIPSDRSWQLENLPPGNFWIFWALSAPGCISYSIDSVLIAVIPPPVAHPDGIFNVLSGEQTEVGILDNDDLLGQVDFRIIRQPTQGEVFWDDQTLLAYQPDVGASGADTLIYEVCYSACSEVCDTSIVLFFNLNNENPCIITADTSNVFTNGLTPNGDGMNDRLVFRVVSVEECEVNYGNSEIMIYNRWGDVVFERSPYNNDWDGSGLPPGVYYFVLRIKVDGKVYSQFGSVIILR